MGCCGSIEGFEDPLVTQLQPLLSVNANYITQSEVIFKLKAKWSGDYVVRDQDGQDMMKVETKAGLKPSTRVLAMDDTLLARSKFTSAWSKSKLAIYGADDQVVATLKMGKRKCCTCQVRMNFMVWDMNDNLLFEIEGGGRYWQFLVRNPEGDLVGKIGAGKIRTFD